MALARFSLTVADKSNLRDFAIFFAIKRKLGIITIFLNPQKSSIIVMGRIKSALIKRTAKALLKEENKFSEGFNNNKQHLGSLMPSKRLRNRIAGYITRINADKQKKKRPQKEIQE